MDFLELVLNEEKRQNKTMPLDSLIVLSRLRLERRLTIADLVPSTQKSEQDARHTIEQLTEAGLVEAHGSGRGGTYTLSASVYRQAGQKAGYVHQVGFDPIKQEQMVLSFIDKHGFIKRADVMELCRISRDRAYKLLYRLKKKELIVQVGELKKAVYERKR